MAGNGWSYPDQNIDPRDKNFAWILQFCKAAWADASNYMPAAMLFSRSQNRFWEIKQYALGKQSISKYKKIYSGVKPENNTELNNDSSVVNIISKFREIALSKIKQREYNLEAFAVDAMAQSEEDEFFNRMKIKIILNNYAKQLNPKLAENPSIKLGKTEPQDLEQLQMIGDFGYKHAMAYEAELGIDMAFNQNNQEQQRTELDENLYDFGIGGFKIWIDEKGMPKYRAVCGENLITSYCVKSDFSDATHIGEIIQVPVVDLVPYFDKGQIEQICKVVAGKFGNPASFDTRQNRWWDKFSVMALDLQFFSWNTTVYESRIDGSGNEKFGKTDFKNLKYVKTKLPQTQNVLDDIGVGLINSDVEGGASSPVYISKQEKVVYKAKWLIGTEMMYDYGLKEQQTSSISSWWDKKMDYIISAWSFYKMQFGGITERLIPIADAFQLTWRKLQNLKNKLIPYLIELDLSALESVGLGKGNADMTPSQIIDFAFENNILLKRTANLITQNQNYKAMEINATGQLEAFTQLYADLDKMYMLLQQISGLNQATDGSTIAQKTLNGATDAMLQSTNNALFLISDCEKRLIERLGQEIVEKIQLSVKHNEVKGFTKALGGTSVKFFKINPNISLYELGIKITDVLSQDERSMLLQEINMKDSQGLLNPADKLMVMKCRNLTQAMIYLNYIVKKRKEEAQTTQMQMAQQQQQMNVQATVMAEKAKQATLQMQIQGEIEVANVTGQWNYLIAQMKSEGTKDASAIITQGKIIASQITAEAKKATSGVIPTPPQLEIPPQQPQMPPPNLMPQQQGAQMPQQAMQQ